MISPKYDLCVYVLLSYELVLISSIFDQKYSFYSKHINILYIRNQNFSYDPVYSERARTKVATTLLSSVDTTSI